MGPLMILWHKVEKEMKSDVAINSWLSNCATGGYHDFDLIDSMKKTDPKRRIAMNLKRYD